MNYENINKIVSCEIKGSKILWMDKLGLNVAFYNISIVETPSSKRLTVLRSHLCYLFIEELIKHARL